MAGDVLEEFHTRQSRLWLWRQVVVAIAMNARTPREIRPLRLVDRAPGAQLPNPAVVSRRTINLTASPVPGVGGLGLLALAVLITLATPHAWIFLLAVVLDGILLGAAWAFINHRYLQHGGGPSGILFGGDAARHQPASGARRRG
jgi:hypothetical protein